MYENTVRYFSSSEDAQNYVNESKQTRLLINSTHFDTNDMFIGSTIVSESKSVLESIDTNKIQKIKELLLANSGNILKRKELLYYFLSEAKHNVHLGISLEEAKDIYKLHPKLTTWMFKVTLEENSEISNFKLPFFIELLVSEFSDHKLNGKELIHLLKNNPNVKGLYFLGIYFDEHRSLMELFSTNEKITLFSFIAHRCTFEKSLSEIVNAQILNEITILNLSNNELRAKHAEVIAQSKSFGKLTTLVISWNKIGAEGARLFAQLANLESLTLLDLSGNNIGAEGARFIAESKNLGGLTSLWIFYNNVGVEGARFIAESKNLGGLTELEIGFNSIQAEGARFIAESKNLGGLTTLGVSGNNIGAEGARFIAESKNLGGLTSLNISRNNIGVEGARFIAESKNLGGLTELGVALNFIGPRGLRLLTYSKNLPNVVLNPGL